MALKRMQTVLIRLGVGEGGVGARWMLGVIPTLVLGQQGSKAVLLTQSWESQGDVVILLGGVACCDAGKIRPTAGEDGGTGCWITLKICSPKHWRSVS